MIAHLLCPGPSLSHYKPGGADIVLGVNRACVGFDCHFMCSNDYPMLRDWYKHAKGRPKLLTTRQTWTDTKGKIPEPPEVRLAEELPESVPGVNSKSFSPAMVLAGVLGATEVQVYGADWVEVASDWDGITLQSNSRGADRWAGERVLFESLVAWLEGRGTKVIRNVIPV